ncbi:TetR/AcrR family transcriptional regulator [Acuticoccus kandeliae]|uniref:TetR/AcrR family transcriptional regulator n=1 Tax=Acuticoccus kandeliae TaxID=2073160 RepID=UPI000D3E485D|nr:TetR/AcrR family transcriptional regulator [Acuticoccus kandeliae]
MIDLGKKPSLCCPGSGRRGRPPQLTHHERETAILDAVEAVAATKGLQGTTMSAIARAAGMSKRTLYTIYDSRDALFEAWVRRVRASIIRPLGKEEEDLPVEERLRRMLRYEAQGTVSEHRIMVLRALVAEGQRHPELARAFMRAGPETVRAMVRDELDRAVARGEIEAEDTACAAKLLCDMVFTNPLDKLVDPEPAITCAANVETRLELAIHIFLFGLCAKAKARAGTPAIALPEDQGCC